MVLPRSIRPPAVAGSFYPEDPAVLDAEVRALLADAAGRAVSPGRPPKVLIVPHAGYVYSGPVAASAYARLLGCSGRIHRVVLVGPSHRVPFRGLAYPTAAFFQTPLGDVRVDTRAVSSWADLPFVTVRDDAHAFEHSLEVQLPFLQRVLGDFEVVPLVVGDAHPRDVATAIERVWGGEETLVVVSSDLSHYLDDESAKRMDAATTESIRRLDDAPIDFEAACGARGVAAALRLARAHGLAPEVLDVRTSGDTQGPRDRVVGYGAYAFA